MTADGVERPPSGPSSWAHRGPLLALGCAGFAIATYLAVHQARGTMDAVWEPFFGQGSARVLGSSVARLLPVPDAAIGAAGYAAEVVVGSIGGSERWRTSPRTVLAFVAIALAMGVGSLGLLVVQPLVFHALCTLCIASAVISIALALGALDEGRAALAVLRGRIQTTEERGHG